MCAAFGVAHAYISPLLYSLSPPLHLQILFLSGVMMIIGINKTFRFFFQKRKLKGGSAPRPSGPTHASPLLRLAPAPHFLPPRTCLPPGTACFLGGIGLVLLGWPVIGMGVEGFGFLNLFGCTEPAATSYRSHSANPHPHPHPHPYPRPHPNPQRLLPDCPRLPAQHAAGRHAAQPAHHPLRARAPAYPPAHPPRSPARSPAPRTLPPPTRRATDGRLTVVRASQVTDRFVQKARLPV